MKKIKKILLRNKDFIAYNLTGVLTAGAVIRMEKKINELVDAVNELIFCCGGYEENTTRRCV